MKVLDVADLMRLVALHEEWIQSREQSGQRLMLNNVTIANVDLQNRRLSRSSMHDVTWTHSTVSGTRFGACSVENVRFEDCDLQGLILSDCKIRSLVILHSKCRAMEFDSSYVHDLVLEGGDAPNVSFLRALLARARMPAINLRGSTFRRSIIEDSDFRESDFTDVNFSRASIKRTDFRGCVMAGCIWERTWLDAVKVAGARGGPKDFTDVRTENVTLTEEPNEQPLQPGDEARLDSFLRQSRIG